MSLRPTPRGEVAAATAAVARAAFARANRCLERRDALGPIFEDGQFKGLFAVCGRPAECPWRLALATLLPFAEDLSDRRAAEAVRGRIVVRTGSRLSGPIRASTPRCRASSSARLGAGGAEALLFDTLLDGCRERGLLVEQGRPRDVLHPRAGRGAGPGPPRRRRREPARGDGRARGRRARPAARPWPVRPGPAAVPRPRGRPPRAARRDRAARLGPERVGCCGPARRAAVMASDAPSWRREVPAALVLRRVWVQSFTLDEGKEETPGAKRSVVSGRTQAEGFAPSLRMVASPCDPDVHHGPRRARRPRGSDARSTSRRPATARPPLITRVATTPAPVVDRAALALVHAALKGLLPDRHLVDAGYLDAD